MKFVACYIAKLKCNFTDLSRNNITTVADSNFRGQDGLHDLDLSYNKITILKTWTFQHLKVNETN